MSRADNPVVSVLMAAYNRERYIEEAIRSMLRQDYADLEVVVVDDGSDDRTVDVVASLAREDDRVKLFRKDRAGVAAARNFGMERVRGGYTAIMDSDDVSLPQRVGKQVAFLDAHPEIAGVGTRYFFVNNDGTKRGPRRHILEPDAAPMTLPTDPSELRERLLERGVLYFLHPTSMFRTGAIRAVGRYRPIFRVASDSDLHLRLLAAGFALSNLDEVLFHYRMDSDNITAVTSLEVLMHRVMALASAHRRLMGLDDPVDGRTRPFDYAFLMEVMEPVGTIVWLEWIGVLQYHGNAGPGMLENAWRHVLAMPHEEARKEETLRHWRNLCGRNPELAAALRGEFSESPLFNR